MNTSQSRKVHRQADQSGDKYRVIKKSAVVLGTTLTACSVVAPLVSSVQAEAVETSIAQVSTSNFAAPNTSAFIAEIATYAQPVANANDLYASVMIAQAILESGWGRSSLSKAPNYNLFGIKGSYNGQTVYMSTLEYLNNQWLTMNEPFKRYPSYTQSFEDNARTLRSTSLQSGVAYYSGAWKSNTTSYLDATAWLAGRYATAPNYASSLNAVIQQFGLTKYDTPASGNAGGGATASASTSTTTTTSAVSMSGSQTYTVASGDSVWSIANKHGISMDQLRSLNNIKNDFVYPGQTLKVNGSAQSTSATSTVSIVNRNASATTSGNTYTVVSGDSVWSIANKHGISMDQFRSLNNIKNDFVYPGQKVVVSGGSSTNTSSTTTVSTASTASQSSGGTYTVAAGDSVWSIANKHGISMDQFRSLNNIKNDYVYPGQKVVVSGSSTRTSTTTSTTVSSQTSSSAAGNTYTVASGDSVWSVANKHGISMDQFRSLNNIKNDFIYPGQKVVVKQGGTAATTSTSATNGTYKVASGDSVWGIADKFGITTDQFIQWNNIQNNFIYPGQTVRVK